MKQRKKTGKIMAGAQVVAHKDELKPVSVLIVSDLDSICLLQKF